MTVYPLSTTELHIACANGDLKRTKELLNSGEDPNVKTDNSETPLHLAVATSYTESVIKELLKYGAKISELNNTGESCFAKAVRHGHTNIVKLLLNWGN